ncbi:kinase-like protein [Aspergillus steynii IBT 23096]|uniref:Kinase-like protein n=1 Tax=Aspergillus steynii IBT 23096 TaxID=1392250 RepID=A0A2I2G3W2_9EURO|nr:kinase-like protein [Aspergillus steynii IBT 23096]PLB47575.1 kinase-like protein [Aspergillus steynii IBT 23096]
MSNPAKENDAQILDGGPRMNIMFSAPDFTVPSPDSVNEMVTNDNTIFHWGGVRIARISPEMVVKFGSHVTLAEAKNMMFVKQNTETLPVPNVFAYYTYGPIDRDVLDYGSLFDTYMFMSYVEGQSLDKAWETYDEETKFHVTNQLKGYIRELRSIPSGNYIGSADSGPVTDPILEAYHNKGPFDSEEAVNNTLIAAYQSKVPRSHVKTFLSGMLSQNTHQIVFTHGDLHHPNTMVKDGVVSGIVDWEFSGWYPEYWEFIKALYIWQWQNDWFDYLVQILRPYYAEYGAHSFLAGILW